MKLRQSILRAALLLVVCSGITPAAEKIRWEELERKLAHSAVFLPAGPIRPIEVNHRSIDVFTKDGRKHHTRRLWMDSSKVMVYGRHNQTESLPRETIARIEIRQRGRYFHHIIESAQLPLALAADPLGSGGYNPLGILLTSPIWVYTAASAPTYLIADGIALFRRPQVFEIVP